MEELIKIGRNIAKQRQERGMTQEDLCGAAQIDRSYLSEIENGKMNVTIKSLKAIADALEVKLIDLLSGL